MDLGSAAASASAYEAPASAEPAGSSSSGGAAGVGVLSTVAVSDFIDLSFAPGGSLTKEGANVAGMSLVTPTMSGALDDQIPTGLVTREERQAAFGSHHCVKSAWGALLKKILQVMKHRNRWVTEREYRVRMARGTRGRGSCFYSHARFDGVSEEYIAAVADDPFAMPNVPMFPEEPAFQAILACVDIWEKVIHLDTTHPDRIFAREQCLTLSDPRHVEQTYDQLTTGGGQYAGIAKLKSKMDACLGRYGPSGTASAALGSTGGQGEPDDEPMHDPSAASSSAPAAAPAGPRAVPPFKARPEGPPPLKRAAVAMGAGSSSGASPPLLPKLSTAGAHALSITRPGEARKTQEIREGIARDQESARRTQEMLRAKGDDKGKGKDPKGKGKEPKGKGKGYKGKDKEPLAGPAPWRPTLRRPGSAGSTYGPYHHGGGKGYGKGRKVK